MNLGLTRGTVQLESYDPGWRVEFNKEKRLLGSTFGDRIVAIEHIGSTSIPGLMAKPVIDMIVAITSFDELDNFVKPLQVLGYEYMPERMFADRKFFPKGPRSNRTHHLNLVLKDDLEQWVKPIAFRDYLRRHAVDRDEYARIKSLLAKKYNNDREMYTKSKNDFIQSILRKALSEI